MTTQTMKALTLAYMLGVDAAFTTRSSTSRNNNDVRVRLDDVKVRKRQQDRTRRDDNRIQVEQTLDQCVTCRLANELCTLVTPWLYVSWMHRLAIILPLVTCAIRSL